MLKRQRKNPRLQRDVAGDEGRRDGESKLE
jgi:hypothetical protein